jgi:hypothetical protein
MIMLQAVLDWFARIMWHGLRRYVQVTQVKTVTGPDEYATSETRKLATGCSTCGEENGKVVGARQCADTSAMVSMLMGHQNRVNIVSGYALRCETQLHLFAGQTAVYQHERFTRVDQRRVPFATAAEGRDPH